MSIQVRKTENNGVVYADPAVANMQIRFKQSEQIKNLDGFSLTNHVTEIIVNDIVTFTKGQKTISEPISVRVRVSGSTEAQARLKELLKLGKQLETWADEHVYRGFRPVSAPNLA